MPRSRSIRAHPPEQNLVGQVLVNRLLLLLGVGRGREPAAQAPNTRMFSDGGCGSRPMHGRWPTLAPPVRGD